MTGPFVSSNSSLAIRRFISGGLVLMMATSDVLAARVELPVWKDERGKSVAADQFALGGSLFPSGTIPSWQETVVEAGAPPVATPESQPEEIDSPAEAQTMPLDESDTPPKPVSLRLPEINPIPIITREEEYQEYQLPPIEGALREEYFTIRPVDYLVDPQHLLTEQKKNDIARFLEYHAEEARYHIYVMVFGKDQTIPEDIDLDQLRRDWFQGEEAVLVAYHLGQPEQSITGFNTEATNLLPKEVFDRVQQYCITEAQIATDPADQIERFMIEMSTRLWWVAKLIERQVIKGTALSATEAEQEMSKPAWETASAGQSVAPPSFSTEHPEEVRPLPSPSSDSEFNLLTWLIAALVLLLVGLGTGIGTWLWRRDALTSQPLLFPDRELPSRLGGDFSGGAYVGVSFAMEGEE